jgi:hypothetical protein
MGCTGDSKDSSSVQAEEQPCDQVENTQVAVITEMWFARINDGESWGADLDGGGDGCGVEDLTDPEGNGGIDNGFGALLPALELTEGAAIEVYIQNLINSGEILILLEMEDVDDPDEDACVNVNLLRGLGEPTVGTDKIIESGQTFDRDLDLPLSRTEGQSIVDGSLIATPLEFSLPFTIFDVNLTFNLQESTLRFDQGIEGHHTGYLAGGLFTEEITSFVEGRDDIDIGDLVVTMVENRADLWPDESGVCQGISVVFEFKAKPAFFYVD